MQTERRHILRPLAAQDGDRLGDLQRVAHGAAQRLLHRGEYGASAHASVLPDAHHRLREAARILRRLHECAGADLHVEQQVRRADGELLAHDAGGNEGNGFHCGGDIAQRVRLAVGRRQVSGLRRKREAVAFEQAQKLIWTQLHPQPGDGFQLIHGAAGVAQAAPRHLGDRQAARRRERSDGQRDLVADAAGAMLVSHRRDGVAHAQLGAGVEHGQRERNGLGGVHPAPDDGHEEGGHLVIRHVAARVGLDQPLDLTLRERAPIAFAPDEVHGVHAPCPSRVTPQRVQR